MKQTRAERSNGECGPAEWRSTPRHPSRPAILYAEDDENDAFFMQRAFAKLKLEDTLRIV